MEAILVKDQKAAAFVMEDGTFEGVYRITEKVCGDVEQVTGVRPKIIKWQGGGRGGPGGGGGAGSVAAGAGVCGNARKQ